MHIYLVGVTDEKTFLFKRFCDENAGAGELDILKRLSSIGHVTGAEDSFFKFGQWRKDERICYLYAEPPNLRLYCIWMSEKIIVIGGGASKNVIAWQDDAKLIEEATWMIQVSSDIRQSIAEGKMKISDDGYRLEGNLKFNYDDRSEQK